MTTTPTVNMSGRMGLELDQDRSAPYGNLVSARLPKDLPAFGKAMLEMLDAQRA